MSKQSPNVIMILADQHHADLMGCAGHPQALTPHLDALAAGGVRCSAVYCQNPICTPSRVSILSGQYCHNHGYYGLSGPTPSHLPSLFGHFRRHGYRTAGFGKLHLPACPHNWVLDDVDRFGDAFESGDGERGQGIYLQQLEALGLRDREDSFPNLSGRYAPGPIPNDARPTDMPYEHTLEMWCAREAMRFIDEGEAQPFFVQLAFQKPHHPLLPVQRFWDLYDEDLDLPPSFEQDPAHRPPHFQEMYRYLRSTQFHYAKPGETYVDGARRVWRGTLACISQVDDVVGQLVKFLDDADLTENTIVIYGSDHGCYHTIHGIPEKAPGIGSDAVCRVPMLWRGPGIASGHVSDQLVENVDMAATLPALCGLPAMDTADGCDISGLLGGGDAAVREGAFTEHPLSKSVRFDRWRFTHYHRQMFDGPRQGELYDLVDDPDETINLFDDPDHREVVERGRALLLDWQGASRRVVTSHPAAGPQPMIGKESCRTAGDGAAPREWQPIERLKQPGISVNYF